MTPKDIGGFNNDNLRRILEQVNATHQAWTKSVTPICNASLIMQNHYIDATKPIANIIESFRPAFEINQQMQKQMAFIGQNMQAQLAANNQWVQGFQGITSLGSAAAEVLKSINDKSEILNNQFSETTRTIRESLAMNTKWVEGFQGIVGLGSNLAQAMEPFNNILTHSATIHQEQMQRMFQSIASVSYDTDFANIKLSYMNELVADIGNENIDVQSLVLTESEIQQVITNIDIAMQGVTLTLDEYLNMLFEYTANAPTNVKIFMLDFIKQNIFKIIFAFLVCCDLIPVSAGLTLVTSQLMATQKASEKSTHKLSAITNKPMQIRKSLRIKAKI